MRRRKRGFRLKHLILLLLMFWLGKTLISQNIMMNELVERKTKEEQELSQLKNEIEQIEIDIENKDSLSFVEKVAREELKLVKPREIIYIDKNNDKSFFVNPNK